MSIVENDSIYNSSNEDDDEMVANSRSRASHSSRPPPGLSTLPTVGSHHSGQIPPRVVGMIPDNYGTSGGELDFKDSQNQDELEELGLNLGRRLARLELGNKINKEKLEKIKERCRENEKTRAMENVRVDDLEGKLISMEARLASEEKQGFDAKEKIESLEKSLKIKDKEILELKAILLKADEKRVKEEEKLSKLEEGSGQLTKQFLVLLETCETFNDELQSLKKVNIELKKELKKKEEAKVKSTEDIPTRAPVPDSGGQTNQKAPKLKELAISDAKLDRKKVSSTTMQSSRNFNTTADESGKPGKKVNPSNALSQTSGYYAQEFIPQNQPGYYYSGPAGPGPYYYTPAPQPTVMVFGRQSAHGTGVQAFNSAEFSGYQNHEYGPN